MTIRALECPACQGRKSARRALNQRGAVAVDRLTQLLDQIRAGVALREIEITT